MLYVLTPPSSLGESSLIAIDWEACQFKRTFSIRHVWSTSVRIVQMALELFVLIASFSAGIVWALVDLSDMLLVEFSRLASAILLCSTVGGPLLSDILLVVSARSDDKALEEESKKVWFKQLDAGGVGTRGGNTAENPSRWLSSTLVEKAGQPLRLVDCCLSDVDFDERSEHNCGCRLRKALGFGLRIFFTRNSAWGYIDLMGETSRIS